MSASKAFRTRSPVKQNYIVESIRNDIVQGRIQPGGRLPTRTELELRFNVSNATLQRALDRLMQQGFAYAKGTLGTFVSEHPPHIAHVGLVFSLAPTDIGYTRFYAAITNEAQKYEHATGRKMTIYCGGGAHGDSEEFRRLVRHVRHHRVGGLIFMHPVDSYVGTPVLDEPGIARVSLGAVPRSGLAVVHLSRESLIVKGLDELVKKGRRRLAIVTSSSDVADRALVERWIKLSAERGLATGLHWIQGCSLNVTAGVGNIARLLMFGGQTDRPDALIIMDDNLVEHATAGLVAAGVNVPADLDVIAHCNFPWPTPSVLPVTRVGFNNTDFMKQCVRLIDQMIRGEKPLPVTDVNAVREDEVV